MIKYKIFTKDNYFFIIDVETSKEYSNHKADVVINKQYTDFDFYTAHNIPDWNVLEALKIGELIKEDDSPYTESEFETFYQQFTGKSSGGSGGGAGDASATNQVITNTKLTSIDNKVATQANQTTQIGLETTIKDDTAISKGYLQTIASKANADGLDTVPKAIGSSFYPSYKGVKNTTKQGLNIDPGRALITRGAVTTDEGTFRVNFANTSIEVSIGAVSISGKVVTGSGFIDKDINLHDYFKLDSDPESSWSQIDYVVDDTTLILTVPYVGGISGNASRALVMPVTQPGGSYSVANGQLTINSGTTSAGGVIIGRIMDYSPLVYRTRLSISQRVVNNETLIGLAEPVTINPPRWTARFIADGTVNTVIKCETSRNPTTSPSAFEKEITTVNIPNGANTSQMLDYRVEQLTEVVRFYISGVLVAEHSKVIPSQADIMVASVRSFNSGIPASNTTTVVDYLTVKNHNKLEIGILSDSEKVIASAAPLQGFIYSSSGVIPINTDLIILDCSQLRSLFIQCNSMGTTGVATVQWSNEPTFTQPITATLLSEAGATSTTFNASVMRVTNVIARYCRIRLTTATTAGTTTLNVWGAQEPYIPIISTQPVSGTLSAVTNLNGGQSAHSAAVTGNPLRGGGKVVPTTIATQDTTLVANDAADFGMTTSMQQIVKSNSTSELDFNFIFQTVATTVTPQSLVQASGTASIRNYIKSIRIQTDTLGAAGTVYILDGALTLSSIAITTGLVTTSVAHDLKIGDTVVFTALASGTGVTVNTLYYVTAVGSATTFNFSASIGGANVVPSVAYTGTTMYRILDQIRLQTTAFQPTVINYEEPLRNNPNMAVNFLIPTSLTSGNIYLTTNGYRGF